MANRMYVFSIVAVKRDNPSHMAMTVGAIDIDPGEMSESEIDESAQDRVNSMALKTYPCNEWIIELAGNGRISADIIARCAPSELPNP